MGFIFTTLAYVLGAAVFFFHTRSRFDKRQSYWLLFAGLVGGILGAKLIRFLFAVSAGADLNMLWAHPEGRTIIGGILCGWLSVEICKRMLKIERSTGDAFALALSVGEAAGRIGCFFNSCCCGAPAAGLSWAVFQAGSWRHPAQIYSAISASLIFICLVFLRKKVKYEGDLFRIYVVLEASSRFCLEFVRERTEVFYGLSMAQWVCLEMALAMILGSWWFYRGLRGKNLQIQVPVAGSDSGAIKQ